MVCIDRQWVPMRSEDLRIWPVRTSWGMTVKLQLCQPEVKGAGVASARRTPTHRREICTYVVVYSYILSILFYLFSFMYTDLLIVSWHRHLPYGFPLESWLYRGLFSQVGLVLALVQVSLTLSSHLFRGLLLYICYF